MRLKIALFCLLLFAHSAAAAQPEVRIFNLRGIPLGMPLARFRAMPFPDRDAFPTVRTFCSDDPGAGSYESLRVDSTLLQAGIVKCGYFLPEKSPGPTETHLVTAQLDVFGEAVTPLFLFYRPDGSDDHSLAQITFGLPNQNASALIVLFRRAYGAPTSFDVSTLRTGYGLEFANISYVWAGERSSIKVDTISFVLNQMSVVFMDNRLWGDLHERLLSIESVSHLIAEDQKRRRSASGSGDPSGDDSNERPGLLPGVADPDADPDFDANSDGGSDPGAH
ncbi:MAG: hypothetical protein JWL84_374 [Rhodospirillales bacterium]|jgi:hypothetical protein|nr:hypothetical protein [Rhodospirillales bacterium]